MDNLQLGASAFITVAPFLLLSLVNLALALWVGNDARRRGDDAPVWALGVLITSALGLVLYLVMRRPLPPRRP